MFNDDKDKLQVVFEPLNRLSEDVEKLKTKLQNMDVNDSPPTITDSHQSVHDITMRALLLDVNY